MDDTTNKALYQIKQILSDNPDYTSIYKQNDDGTYKVIYENLFLKDVNNKEIKGSIIIPRCSISLYFDSKGKFTKPIIDYIFPVKEEGELFVVYSLDEEEQKIKQNNYMPKILKIEISKEVEVCGKKDKIILALTEPKDMITESVYVDISSGKNNTILLEEKIGWLSMFSEGTNIKITFQDENGKINSIECQK